MVNVDEINAMTQDWMKVRALWNELALERVKREMHAFIEDCGTVPTCRDELR